jgi:ArsR family transcriptional regulator
MVRERGVCCTLPSVNRQWAAERADLMSALADPTRLTMMASLWKAAGPICVCDFTAGLGLTQPTISHHVAKLKAAGLVDSEKRGIWVNYRVADRLPAATRELLSGLLV